MVKKALLLTKFNYQFTNAGAKPLKIRKVVLPLDRMIRRYTNFTFGSMPHLGIGIVASELQSLGYSVAINDLQDPPARELASQSDLVGVSFLDISFDHVIKLLQDLDLSKTILGGLGASVLEHKVRESFPNASIVLGESEGIIEDIVNDLQKNGLKQTYKRDKPVNLRYLSPKEPYLSKEYSFRELPVFRDSWLQVLEIGRGCHNKCRFCLTDNKISYKPIEIIEQELKITPKHRRMLFLIDQNLCSYPDDYLIDVFTLINKTGMRWVGEGTIEDKIGNSKLMQLMAKNCFTFLAGVEDLHYPDNAPPSKRKLAHNLRSRVKELRDYNFPVFYSLMFGNDDQVFPESFIESANKVNELGITVNAHLTTPREGTLFNRQLEESNRIIDRKYAHRNQRLVVYEPKKMSMPELRAGFTRFHELVFSPQQIAKRAAINSFQKGIKYSAGLVLIEAYGFLWKTVLKSRYNADVKKYFH